MALHVTHGLLLLNEPGDLPLIALHDLSHVNTLSFYCKI